MARILLVEDYKSLQDLYSETLMNAGYDLLIASSGKDALDKATTQKFDLIILDMLLEEMNGMDFLRAYSKAGLNTKILVFSNVANPKIIKETISLGAVDYLIKSNFTPSELLDVVRKILSSQKEGSEEPKEN